MKFFTENSPAFLHLKGLCDTLAQDADFQEMRHNLSEFKKDEIAKKQLEALTAMGNVIRTKQSRKEELIPREVEEFEELRTDFLSNPVAAAFVESGTFGKRKEIYIPLYQQNHRTRYYSQT
jgi:hypothetical protein